MFGLQNLMVRLIMLTFEGFQVCGNDTVDLINASANNASGTKCFGIFPSEVAKSECEDGALTGKTLHKSVNHRGKTMHKQTNCLIIHVQHFLRSLPPQKCIKGSRGLTTPERGG